MAKVLEFQLQYQSFQWIFRGDSFRIDCLISPAVQGFQEPSPAQQLESINPLAAALFMVQFSHPYMSNEKNHNFDYSKLCWQSDVSAF